MLQELLCGLFRDRGLRDYDREREFAIQCARDKGRHAKMRVIGHTVQLFYLELAKGFWEIKSAPVCDPNV